MNRLVGRIVGREFVFNEISRARFLENNSGKQIVIEVPKIVRSRTQNNYLWVYYGVIEQETGNNADDIHEWAKRKFLPPRFITVNGEELRIPGTTTGLTKTEFGEFLEKICAATEIPLPDPTLAGYISNYER